MDHLSNNKRGGVCLYHKGYLPLIARDDLFTIQECLVTEISVIMKNVPSHFYTGPQVKEMKSEIPFVST